MLNIDYTSLFIQIINFLLLLWVMNILVYRPIRNILSKRKNDMASTGDLTQALGQKTSQSSNELNANISNTRKQGIKERDILKSEGDGQEQKILKDTYSLAQEKIDKARKEMEDARLRARDSLQADVKGFSTDLVKKLLGRGI